MGDTRFRSRTLLVPSPMLLVAVVLAIAFAAVIDADGDPTTSNVAPVVLAADPRVKATAPVLAVRSVPVGRRTSRAPNGISPPAPLLRRVWRWTTVAIRGP